MPKQQTSALPKGKLFELPRTQLAAAVHTQVIASLMFQREMSELERETIKKLRERVETAKTVPELVSLLRSVRDEELDQNMRVALDTAIDILNDGEKTIYHPAHWSTRSLKDCLNIAIAGVLGAIAAAAAEVYHGQEMHIEVTRTDIVNSAIAGAIVATAGAAELVP